MGDIVKNNDNHNIITLLHSKNGALDLPKPFAQDIFLFDTHVAGTTHIAGMEELAPLLEIGERLQFIREPENPYDKMAIAIKTEEGVKLGYVPKADNAIFARLMDAGKLLFGKIAQKEQRGRWHRIIIEIYLHE